MCILFVVQLAFSFLSTSYEVDILFVGQEAGSPLSFL